ncbi:TetR family transcriptional regulator [Kineococcus sp. NPDC059986]|jgi:AcrR family transcriptional regulator|uniref:TetR/AcrR family transcriptional regulator n=1 Tax=Kineococcus sp. NPDC059986 TaxID=3155538 RepID=UPI00344B0773
MARWEPGARERLQAAALDLFVDQGYDETTVSQIAARAGVTDRTFFRHFSDKRESLFAGSEQLVTLFTDAVARSTAPDPLDVASEALAASTAFFPEERRPWARTRTAVVLANPALAEREQLKMVTIAQATAGALRDRGVEEPAATLLGHSTVTVFQVAFERWIRDGEDRSMGDLLQDTLSALRETLVPRT